MNKKMLALTAMAVLVGGSASYAKPISKDADVLETELVGESAESRMDKGVQKFVEAQKKNNLKRSVLVTSDLLGRRGGSLKGKGSLKYEINDSDVQKIKVVISDIKVNDATVQNTNGRYEFNSESNQKVYWLNGSKVSEKDYLDKADKRRKKYDSSRKSFRAPRIAYLTASEIEKELSSNETTYISEYKKPKPQITYGVNEFWDYRRILVKSGVTAYAHNNGIKGKGVGVHYNEGGCVPRNYINPGYFQQLELPCNSYSTHAIGVMRILQTTAPESKLYGLQDVYGPANPANYTTPILVGSNSWDYVIENDVGDYTDGDATMDNYIYENGVVEFVAASNEGRESFVGSPSRALNAISVGAISPVDNKYVDYSSSKNGRTFSDKPEVANYTNFIFPDDPSYTAKPGDTYNGYFNGTSAATPFMAGMTANLLSNHPFLWWHPELVKAVLIVGSNPVQNPEFDIDGTNDFEAGIPYYGNFAQGKDNRWNFWAGNNNSNFDSDREIKFTEANIKQGRRYRIAISWLTSGEFAMRYRRVAQDLDLSVWQNGKKIASSATAYNPFELVDFVAPTSDPLTIKIKRYNNLSSTEKVAIGYAFNRVN
ncbi:S8 family serine peptidase [Fibrobacter sp. UWB11]|uniref:S8 family serine peptidase n=1 Tax=Fibrobacter sp. UWB11 TaxID=1896202 RepID=UPI0009292C4D|nr:S8 family serine peptidase [Fibrobacter sp. UWB11]SIO31507.1 Serine protease, subtilisin family [Fibrobacter sp. UWB11]